MIKEINTVLNSTNFKNWLSQNRILTDFLNGYHRKRELLIRDKIFYELERESPGRFQKEKRYRDLIDLKTGSICELGHSGMFQNPHFVANKCLTDYYKRKIRQNDSRNYYSLQIFTDIRKYSGSIKYKDKVDVLNNNRSIKFGDRQNRISIVNNDFSKISCDKLSNPLSFLAKGNEIDLYYILSGPLVLNWLTLKKEFNIKDIDLSRIK